MKLDQLKVLRAVVETGSVKLAAESLNRTQPAISQALKALEFQSGAALFDRSGYRLELTPVGQRVYLQSLRVLSEADDLAHLIRHFEQGQEETMTIAIDAAADLAAKPVCRYKGRSAQRSAIWRNRGRGIRRGRACRGPGDPCLSGRGGF